MGIPANADPQLHRYTYPLCLIFPPQTASTSPLSFPFKDPGECIDVFFSQTLDLTSDHLKPKLHGLLSLVACRKLQERYSEIWEIFSPLL